MPSLSLYCHCQIPIVIWHYGSESDFRLPKGIMAILAVNTYHVEILWFNHYGIMAVTVGNLLKLASICHLPWKGGFCHHFRVIF